MTATGGIAAGGPPTWPRLLLANFTATLATLLRKPRSRAAGRLAWSTPARLLICLLIAIVAATFAVAFLDLPAVAWARRLPPAIVAFFDDITDYGKSGWFLYPIGTLLLVIALAAVTPISHFSRLVLATLTVRLGFLFLAIG